MAEDIKIKKVYDSTICINGKKHSLVSKIHKRKLPETLQWCEQCGAILMEKDGLIALPYRDI